MLEALKHAIQNDKRTIWLETQTWSWKAICLYLDVGFVPRMRTTFNETPNDFFVSYEIISSKIGSETSKRILELAIE